MSNWIDNYKKLVISSHKLHIIVADLDNLFDYAELRQTFENEEFNILDAKTGLDVRLLFELQVRNSSDKYLIVAPANYSPLPDIEMLVQFQAIGLPHLFPNLDGKAIKGLSYNALCFLSNTKLYEELSYDKTLIFLLENLYEVDFDTLTKNKAKERVLNALVSVFLERNGINQPLTNFLTNISKPYFPELTTKGLTNNNIIHYIQELWQSYVEKENIFLDFKEPILSKSLGYLFVSEYLKPIQVTQTKYNSIPKTLKIGVYVDEQAHNDNELDGLIEYLQQQIGEIQDLADEWFKIIRIFAKAKLGYLLSKNSDLKEKYIKLEQAFNTRFQRFLDNNYNSFFTLSGVRKPVVVSRILDHINAKPSKKKALIVIDGMNYWQWNLLSEALTEAELNYSSNASLAYIPTITAWSRQAIFKGDKPDLNENNSKEKTLFESYWLKHGIPSFQIVFRNISFNHPLEVNSISTDTTIFGIVCNDLDDILHGSILGDEQLKMSTIQWIEKSNIVKAIFDLKQLGFQIFITSDHGNIQATGINNITLKEKVGALSRSKRHLQFTNEILLKSFLEQNTNLNFGKNGISVYLKNQEAFTNPNKQIITHGGSHFWEVVVPFITINE